MDGDNTGLDEFQSFLDNDAPKPADSIKQAMVLTQDTQPDRQAQIINLSKSLNLPPSVVDSNFDEFQKKHAVESVPYDSIAEETPGFGAWLQDPNNAALAKDDLDALGSIEKKVRHANSIDNVFDTIMTNVNESIPGITKRFLYRTAEQVSKVPALAYNAFRQVENAQRAALALGGLETEAGEYAPESWVKNKASNYWNAKLAEEQAKVPELGQSVFDTYKKDGASAASKILLMQAADNVPQQLALIATALSGFGTAGLVGMGVTSAADSLEQGYNSKAGPEAATFGAITKGSIEAGFESLGTLGFLHHWENAIANSLGKSASKEIIKDFFKTIAYSFMGEGTEEGLTSVAQDLTDYYTGVNPDALKGIGQRAFDSAIVGGVMGGLLTGPSAIASGTARYQNQQLQNQANNSTETQAPQPQQENVPQQEGEVKAPSLRTYSPDVSYAERARDVYLQIGDASDNNKLKERSPEKLKEVIKSSLSGTGKENIYISPEAIDAKFADPALKDKFLQSLNIAKQYDDAKEAGIAIKVPTEEWVSTLKGTPEYKSLADEIKFSDLAESVSENKAAREKLKEDTKRTAEEAQKDMISQGAEDVANQVVAQLQDTKTYSKTGLNRVKELIQSHFATRGEILQRDPREIFKEEGLNVKQFEDLPAEFKGALEQSNPAAAPFFAKSIQLVEQKVGNTATPEQINGVLKEIKPEERKWMGIDTFLKGKEKVSKEELLQHLRANQLQIEEVTKGYAGKPSLTETQAERKVYNDLQSRGYRAQILDDAMIQYRRFMRGIDENLGDMLPDSMRDEIYEMKQNLQTIKENTGTKFSKYTLPGGENYREVLFRLPDKGVEAIDKKAAREIVEAYRKSSVEGDMKALEWNMTQDQANDAIDAKEYEKYRSSHFDESNVLAHTRLNDRVDADGKKILFVEEIQSDWHQAGRKKGYKGDSKTSSAELDAQRAKIVEAYNAERADALANLKNEADREDVDIPIGDVSRLNAQGITPKMKELAAQYDKSWAQTQANANALPDAPFRKTWHEFVFKRLIREAAEKGYDKIAWTTGEQQADRYNLAKVIDEVHAVKNDDGSYDLEAWGKDFRSGEPDLKLEEKNISSDRIEALVGKDLAQKISFQSDTNWKTYRDADLKVGGEGMKGFYDKILVDFANKFGKKYGAKVEDAKVGSAEEKNVRIVTNGAETKFWVVEKDSKKKLSENFATEKEAQDFINQIPTKGNLETVHSLTITPELRQAALNEGFPLFQADQDTRIVRGFFERAGNLIGLTKHKNLSTFLHEYGHSLLSSAQNDYNYIKSLGDTLTSKQEQFVTDMETLLKHLGADSFDNLNRDQQEEFARSFEAYLMKGKAPSKGLKKAFATFKSWMLKIYAQAKNLQVNLTPELSEIFDRMIAVEDAIYEQQQKFPTLLRESQGDIPQPSEGKMADLMRDAKDYSLSKVTEPSLEYVLKKQEKFYKEERKEVKAKLIEELDKNPNQKALLDMINEKTSIESKSLKDRGDLPAKYFSTDGTPASVLADIYGYHDEQLFIDSLKEAHKLRTEGVEAEADAEMQRRYHDGFTDLEQNALEAIHNEYNKERLRLEAEFLAEKAGGDKKVAAQLIKRLRSDAEIKAEAQRIIGQTTTKDVKPYIYERAEIKAAREASEFYRKGDYVSAFEAKKKEILNHELFKSAYEAQKNIQKAAALFKKFYKPDEKLSKSKDMNIINAGRAVLVQYGFAPVDKAIEDYLQPLSTYDPAGYESVKAIVEGMTMFPGYWADISYGQFSQLKEDVEALYSLAAESKNFEVNKEKMQLETVVNAFVEQAALHPERNQVLAKDAGKFDNFNAKFLSKLASFTRIEHMTKLFDLGTRGVWTNYFWEPINQAFIQYQAARNENIKELFDLTKDYRKSLTWEKIDGTKELGSTGMFKNKSVLIAALKHIGNESNLRKLLVGYNWGQLQEDGTLDTSRWDAFIKRMQAEGVLTKADYDYVQSIWDLHEKIKPEAQRVHKKDTGYYFDEITAREFTTPFGTYKGGYVPLKYDTTANRTVQRNSVKESILTGDFGFQMPSTSKGFTKSRVEFNAPVSLDLSQTLQDFDDVIKYIHLRLPVKQGVRLLYNKEFSNMVDKLNPQLMDNALEPFLLRASQNKVEFNDPRADKEFAAAARFLKSYSTASTMALNVTNALQNYSSLFPAQVRIDPSAATSLNQTRHAFVQYVTNRKETLDFIASKSAYMNTEMTDGAAEAQRDLRDIALKPGLVTNTTEFLQANSFALMQMTQKQTSSIVWLAAYNAAIAKENATDAEAVAHADSVVRTTQGAGRAIDVSKFETGSAWWRAFTMYSGFFLNLANLNASEMTVVKRTLGMKEGAGRLFFIYSFGFMLTAVSADLLMKAVNGRGFDENDDESYLDDFIGTFLDSQYRMGTAMLPLVGPALNAARSYFNDKPYDDKLSLSPVIQTVESAAHGVYSGYKLLTDPEEFKKKDLKDGFTLLGLAASAVAEKTVPLSALNKPAGYLLDYMNGDANPENPVDFTKGLIRGREVSK